MAFQKLTVFRGAAPSNTYVWSPFVIKLEARLRFASVPYTLGGGSPRSAPRGKIPYVDIDGQQTGDSTLIIKDLVRRGVIQDGEDAPLTPLQRAQDLAVRAMMEDRLYFYGAREKWCDNYETMVNGVMGAIPWFLRWFIGMLARGKNVRTLQGQGIGLFSDEEVVELKTEVWDAVDALLTESKRTADTRQEKREQGDPFWVLGGENPTDADATLYGSIVGALICDASPVMAKLVKERPIIVEYAGRIHDRYFPDYEKWSI